MHTKLDKKINQIPYINITTHKTNFAASRPSKCIISHTSTDNPLQLHDRNLLMRRWSWLTYITGIYLGLPAFIVEN